MSIHQRSVASLAMWIALAIAASTPALAVDVAAARFYEDALQRYERDDVAGAIVQLKNALQKEPRMLSAHVLMGKALLRNGDAAGAETVLQKALALGVDRAEITVPLARAYAAQGKVSLLLDRISAEGLPMATRLEVLLLRGNAYAELGNVAAATAAYDLARSLDPRWVPARLAQVNLLLRTGQTARAAELLDDVVKQAPNESAAWNLRGAMAHLRGDVRGALEAYARAVELDRGNLDAQVARAGLLIDVERLAEADAVVDQVQRASPREPRAAYLKAVIASRRNDTALERKSLSDVVALLDPVPKQVLGPHPQLLLLGGLAHHGLGNPEKAADYLIYQVKLDPNQAGPVKLLASIYLDRGDASRAINVLEPLQKSSANDPQLLSLLAAAHMMQRRPGIAARLLEQAAASDSMPDLRSQFGVSLIESGQSDLGIKQLQQAFARDAGQPHAGMLLTALYLKRHEPKRASEAIQAVVSRDPRNVNAQNLLGVARAALGDAAGARAAYQKALEIESTYAPAALNLARLDAAQGATEAARVRLADLVRRDQRNADAMFELAQLEERLGRTGEAIRWLERAFTIPKERIRTATLLTDLLLRERNFDRAVTVARDLANGAPKSVPALFTLARVEIAAGNAAAARQALSLMRPLLGFEPMQNVEAARLQMMAGDRDGALYSLDKALKSNPDHLPALVLLAQAEIAGGEYAKAEQRARYLSERFPASAAGAEVQGDFAMARGRFGDAAASYRIAFAKEPGVELALRLYRAHASAGEPAKGLALLEQFARDRPNDAVLLRALADARLRAGSLTAARTAYEQLLARSPADSDVLNNLAQVASRQGDAAALRYAERAYDLAPSDPAVQDTLGWILARNGDLERAISVLRDARLRDASNPEIRYHLAVALARSGRVTEARAEINESLARGVAFDEIEDARRLQREIGS